MATAGMTNLNDTPSRGPLRAEDFARDGVNIDAIHYRRQQPNPVEPDDLGAARGVVYCIPAALLAWALIATAALAYKFW